MPQYLVSNYLKILYNSYSNRLYEIKIKSDRSNFYKIVHNASINNHIELVRYLIHQNEKNNRFPVTSSFKIATTRTI